MKFHLVERISLIAVLGLQAICATFFVGELVTEVFGLRSWPLPWFWREVLQIAASVGLLIGTIVCVMLIRQSLKRGQRIEQQLLVASGAFFSVIDEKFVEWSLSPSEREVALFTIRGLPNIEIAEIRGTSEATIKSQLNRIYKKANVANRSELLSEFVELLIEKPLLME